MIGKMTTLILLGGRIPEPNSRWWATTFSAHRLLPTMLFYRLPVGPSACDSLALIVDVSLWGHLRQRSRRSVVSPPSWVIASRDHLDILKSSMDISLAVAEQEFISSGTILEPFRMRGFYCDSTHFCCTRLEEWWSLYMKSNWNYCM